MGGDHAGSIGALVSRLVENGKSFVRAEIALAKITAIDWFDQAKIALALLVVAFILVLAALPVLLAALGMALAHWLGVPGGLAAAALIGIACAVILALWAIKQLQGLGR